MNTPSWGAGRVLRAFVSPSVLVSRLVRGITSVVLTLAILTGTAAIVNAQTNADGAIVGKISGDTKGSIAIESRSTGLQRTATVAADGSYRMGSLPPGRSSDLHASLRRARNARGGRQCGFDQRGRF